MTILWLACYTQQEIAEATGVTKETVSEIISSCQKKFQETESDKAAASHAVDFDPPIYNVWKQQEKTAHTFSAVKNYAEDAQVVAGRSHKSIPNGNFAEWRKTDENGNLAESAQKGKIFSREHFP